MPPPDRERDFGGQKAKQIYAQGNQCGQVAEQISDLRAAQKRRADQRADEKQPEAKRDPKRHFQQLEHPKFARA